MKLDPARAPALILAAVLSLACLPACAATLVVSADRMFDARAGKVSGPARVVIREPGFRDIALMRAWFTQLD